MFVAFDYFWPSLTFTGGQKPILVDHLSVTNFEGCSLLGAGARS